MFGSFRVVADACLRRSSAYSGTDHHADWVQEGAPGDIYGVSRLRVSNEQSTLTLSEIQ